MAKIISVGVLKAGPDVSTYFLIYRAVEERGLINLDQYVSERAKREETHFRQVIANLRAAERAFLERLRQPDPPGYLERWDMLFVRFPDGAWRSPRERVDGTRDTTLWAHRDAVLTDELKRRTLILYDMLEQFRPAWIGTFRSLWANTPEMTNVGFDPLIANWVYETPADWPQNEIDYVAAALPKNNPERKIVWTRSLTEAISNEYFVSVCLPVYVNDGHVATIGHDVRVLRLIEDSVRAEIAGMTHMMFSDDGWLIARPAKKEGILATTELQTSEARVRAMLENAPEAIVVIDAGTARFLTGNEKALHFFGVDRERLRRHGPAGFSPAQQPDGRASEAVAREHIAVALRGETTVFEWLHRLRDGSEIPCEVRLSLLPSTTRKLVIGTITDISERKQIEESLRSALERERELGERKSGFVSMVSHEFRTPLGIISSSAEILERYLDRLPPTQRAGHLQSIVRSTRQLNDLIGEVILLGKVESSHVAFKPEPLDVVSLGHRLADEVCSSSGPRCPIAVTAKNDVSGARGDESLLRHIFGNLLSNAVKYSEPGSPVSLTIERAGDTATFEVRDHGIGIPEGEAVAIFEAFHRASNVGTRPGTGLGLVIVQRCVRIHGGDTEVKSRAGAGACFTVRLPLFSANPAAGPDAIASVQKVSSDENDIADRG
ncbi:MAG: PAS domain-containing sensor histidine kinase [Opitutaceae bacterium]